jgi:hypothetical protein
MDSFMFSTLYSEVSLRCLTINQHGICQDLDDSNRAGFPPSPGEEIYPLDTSTPQYIIYSIK